MNNEADRIRAQFERGPTRLYPVEYTSEVARTVENGEEVERMKSRVVDADAEREARIRQNINELSEVISGHTLSFLLRLLDEARAEIAPLRERIDYENTTAAEETGLRISAPPEPAAMALAAGLCRQLELLYLGPEGDEVDPAAQEILARAITEYGEQRAKAAVANRAPPEADARASELAAMAPRMDAAKEAEFARRIAAYGEQRAREAIDEFWRDSSKESLRKVAREARAEYVDESRRLREACVAAARAEARAAAIEEAAQVAECDHETIPCPTHYSAEVARVRARRIAENIRALAPPQPEGGKG